MTTKEYNVFVQVSDALTVGQQKKKSFGLRQPTHTHTHTHAVANTCYHKVRITRTMDWNVIENK